MLLLILFMCSSHFSPLIEWFSCRTEIYLNPGKDFSGLVYTFKMIHVLNALLSAICNLSTNWKARNKPSELTTQNYKLKPKPLSTKWVFWKSIRK